MASLQRYRFQPRHNGSQRHTEFLTGRRRRRSGTVGGIATLKLLTTAFGLLALALATAGLGARYVPITNHVLLGIAALSPYLMLPAPLALAYFAWGRRWFLAGCAAVLTLALVVVQAPLFKSVAPPSGGVTVRVMTANIFLGEVDPHSLVQTALQQADLLSIQELTPQAVESFSAEGLDNAFPYRVLDARPEASGTGLWSRYPITESRKLAQYPHATVVARIRVPGVPVDPTVFAAHLPGPFPQPLDDWHREYAELPAIFDHAAAVEGNGCVMVAGDFNGTHDMRLFRQLLVDGYRDAAEQSGAGLIATFPANLPIPPIIAIDHVLTHRCTATSLHRVDLPGSDHRGLVSAINIPQ